ERETQSYMVRKKMRGGTPFQKGSSAFLGNSLQIVAIRWTARVSLHGGWALQDNCVLQVYSAVCNTIPRTVVWQEGKKRLAVGASMAQSPPVGRCGGRATGGRSTQARHAGSHDLPNWHDQDSEGLVPGCRGIEAGSRAAERICSQRRRLSSA